MCVGDRKAIDQLKAELLLHFKIKDEGHMREYVGCTVMIEKRGKLLMWQPH